MNSREFFNLVSLMRNAQRNYFALRKTGDKLVISQALQQSLDLERRVDAEIARVNDILSRQGNGQQGT